MWDGAGGGWGAPAPGFFSYLEFLTGFLVFCIFLRVLLVLFLGLLFSGVLGGGGGEKLFLL